MNTNGSFHCECHVGFELTPDGCIGNSLHLFAFPSISQCLPACTLKTDADECSNVSVCDTNAECINTNGSYICTCKSGYEGNGTTCTSESLLQGHAPPCYYICLHTHQILDIDECERGYDSNCGLYAHCVDLEGSVACVCNDGYIGNGVNCCMCRRQASVWLE